MDWEAFLDQVKGGFEKLKQETPETFSGFATMARPAKKDGELSEKTKEFIALGIAVATRCDSCIGLHLEHLIRLGATRAQIVEALAMCCYMGGGPAIMYSAKALEAFDQLKK